MHCILYTTSTDAWRWRRNPGKVKSQHQHSPAYQHTLSSDPDGKHSSNPHPLALLWWPNFHAKTEAQCRCWNYVFSSFGWSFTLFSRYSIVHYCYRALADWIQIIPRNLHNMSIPMQNISQTLINHLRFSWGPLYIFRTRLNGRHRLWDFHGQWHRQTGLSYPGETDFLL